MTTVESLKALYVKLGGKAEDVAGLNLIPECIDALNEVAGAGGGYDLVIRCTNEDDFSSTASDYEIAEGDFETLVKKLQGGELIRACAYISYEYSVSAGPYLPDNMHVIDLYLVNAGNDDYSSLVLFGSVVNAGVNESTITQALLRVLRLVISEDGVTGANYKVKYLTLMT